MDWRRFFKEADHIWYYYKIHIIVGVVIAAFVAYYVVSGLTHEEKETALHVVLVGNQVKVEQQTNLQETTTEELLGKNRSDSVIRMDFLPAGEGMNAAVMQKLVAMIAAGEVDVLVMDKKTFSVLGRQGNFLKLDQLKQDISGNVKFISLSVKRSGSGEHAYGILLKKNHQLQRAGFHTKNKVMGIVANSQHPESARQFMKWLVKP